jgi:phosphoadenosine phosphosulfate reductase
VRKHGMTLVIRGQRNAEARKSPIRNGHVEDGVSYWFPIEEWTDAQVRSFLGDRLPAHYALFDSSLDCRTCTGYLNANRGKLTYIEREYPALGTQVRNQLQKIRHDCIAELNDLHAVLGEA